MKKKSRSHKAIGVVAEFLDNEYGVNSYNLAFSEDMGLDIPASPLTGFCIACSMTALTYLNKSNAETLRDIRKGLRDIQNVDEGLSNLNGHGVFFNPYTFLFGSIYAILLMVIRWDKIQQEQEIEENRRTAANLRAIGYHVQITDVQYRIRYENDFAINRWRMLALATGGAVNGMYTSFSAFQVINFISLITPSVVINPIPFVITGLVMAAVFCVKKLYDQRRLNIKKNISVLECQLQLNLLHCRQLQLKIAACSDSKLNTSLRQQLQSKQRAVDENCRKLSLERRKLQSLMQQGNNFINLSQKTLAAIKNNTLGLINLANFLSFTGITAVKIAGGASLLSILGGPIAVVFTITVVATMLLYMSYNMRQRHRAQQQQWLRRAPETELQTFFASKPKIATEIKTQHITLFKHDAQKSQTLLGVHKKIALSKL